ncbi:MAG: ATP-binding protein [Pirellulales bacterium]
MGDQLLQRFGARYILWVLLLTRLVGSVGGVLVVYYVHLTLDLEPKARDDFRVIAAFVVALAVLATILMGLWETGTLRRVLSRIERGQPIPLVEAHRASRQAVLFASRHHMLEAVVIPLCTIPLCTLFMWKVAGVEPYGLIHITVAALLGITMSVLCTFFVVERSMQPVIRHLLRHQVRIEFDALPPSKLRVRLNVCFGLIITTTAVMIGAQAAQQASNIIHRPEIHLQALTRLRIHTGYISLVAVGAGLAFSTVLAQSVASRVGRLVQGMKRVAQGNLDERVESTGNDEIDVLARQFNAMVAQLSHSDYTIRDLNANLEAKVQERTLELDKSRRDLDKRNRELESAYGDLKATQTQLIQAEKMSSLGQLVAGLAHEMNNSVNAVYNGVKPLSQSARRLQEILQPVVRGQEPSPAGTDPREIDKLVERLSVLSGVVENGAARTARIISDLRSFCHPGNEEFDEFDLHEALEVCLNLLFSEVKHRIAIQRDYGSVERIHGPYGQLSQVFMNILNNAQQAIEGEGDITVTTEQHEGWVSVSIQDSGKGITDEAQSRMFDPFFTTKPPGQGTGLGLTISYTIITSLGGTIQCRSMPGCGSEFVVTFPARCVRRAEPLAAPGLQAAVWNLA